MSLLTREKAKEKVCQLNKIERLLFKVISAVHHPSLLEKELAEHTIYCDPKTCAHWCFTNERTSIPVEDLEADDKGNPNSRVTLETMERVGAETLEDYEANFYKGYCGFSPPLEELSQIASHKKEGGQ